MAWLLIMFTVLMNMMIRVFIMILRGMAMKMSGRCASAVVCFGRYASRV
jgi:hypothetical protein